MEYIPLLSYPRRFLRRDTWTLTLNPIWVHVFHLVSKSLAYNHQKSLSIILTSSMETWIWATKNWNSVCFPCLKKKDILILFCVYKYSLKDTRIREVRPKFRVEISEHHQIPKNSEEAISWFATNPQKGSLSVSLVVDTKDRERLHVILQFAEWTIHFQIHLEIPWLEI
jgi:hypothetical protein